MALPQTHKEDELIGGAGDSLMEQAQSTARDELGKVERVAHEATGAAKDAVESARSTF